MIIWSGTTKRRFTNKQSSSEESAPKTFMNVIIKIKSSEHVSQDLSECRPSTVVVKVYWSKILQNFSVFAYWLKAK